MTTIFNWKKEYICFYLIFLITNLHSQQSLGEGTTTAIASPSMTTMARYTDNLVSQITGQPNINIPIVEVPIQDRNIKHVFNLSYNPVYVGDSNFSASDVGAGWTLFGGSMIYKKIIGTLDEVNDDVSSPDYQKNTFDDYYYYSLPGMSGKFQIKRDIVTNTFSLVNLTPNNLKFEYERNSNTATLKIENFTITDGKGYKYIFNDFDLEARYDSGFIIPKKGYKSAYFLTRIVSPIGKILATYMYDKKSRTRASTGELIYQYCKLKSVDTDLGKVIFDYQFDESLADTPNDLFSLKKIVLKNSYDQVIHSFNFNYITSSEPYDQPLRKRLLASIVKNDKNDVKNEKTTFVYNQNNNNLLPTVNNSYCDWPGSMPKSYYTDYNYTNALEKVISPSGGVTQYVYGNHEYFFDYTQDYLDSILGNYVDSDIQEVVAQPDHQFNIAQTNTYTFTISGDPAKKVGFTFSYTAQGYTDPIIVTPPTDNPFDPTYDPNNPNPQPEPFYTDFVIKSSSGELMNGKQCFATTAETAQNTYYGYPGTYTLEFSGKGRSYGIFKIYEIKIKQGPIRKAKDTPHYGRIRLNKIKYYTGINETIPAKTLTYNYDNEDGTGSSGYVFYNDNDGKDNPNEGFILYKNVKISEAGNGYTKIYYLNPDDYPKYQTGGTPFSPIYYYPYYNITKGGLISRKEIYNEQNQLLHSESYTYELDNYTDQIREFYFGPNLYTSRSAYVKKISQDNKDYTKPGGIVEVKKETVINSSNLAPNSIKDISSDGNIKEQQFIYPAGLTGYAHLENAHILSEAVQTITKNNSKVVLNSQVRFDNNSLLPTSVVFINPNDNSVKTTVKYNEYDTAGNNRQYTTVTDENTGKGFSSVIIWGYNNTMPIAKIEGASLADIGSLADDIVLKSNLDKDTASEAELINSLDVFRTNTALKKFQITTYTYDLLIGITTLTPPNGIRDIYKYDQNNKLKTVVNVNGNIIQEYKYNIKQP
ncbi:MAG: hypothetical protein MUW56_06500 [Chryseobacterium sp.]|uniref:hypothetical protein n=1 Tax=Chryseobacterium sp. TaxID=1871047 RepID=UPI0025BD0A75|nr:hypothetical protein [Chryseobacterium sp.]MCJ7933283.1 hypothetical protein [Chryseobacterium sp.]